MLLIRGQNTLLSIIKEFRLSENVLEIALYTLIMKKHLQIPIKCHCVTKKSSKRWLDLSSKTLIFLNFRKLYTSFEICNQKVYSSKNACNSKVNTGLSVQDDQKILKVHYLICPARLTTIPF